MASETMVLDPGVRHPACALFRDNVLVAAGRVKLPGKLAKLDRGERIRQVAMLITQWYGQNTRCDGGMGGPFVPINPLERLVAEWPQVYQAGHQKGDQNDLLLLAGVVGAAAAEFGVEVTTYLPGEWTGGVPKTETGDPWKSPRGIRVWSRLSSDEQQVCLLAGKDLGHDGVDAIGLGLFHHKRFAPRRWAD